MYGRIMKKQKLFSMRVEGEEGERFLSALDDLRLAELPMADRTNVVKKLVFEAHKRLIVAKERGKR
jgi:hypothetical protein